MMKFKHSRLLTAEDIASRPTAFSVPARLAAVMQKHQVQRQEQEHAPQEAALRKDPQSSRRSLPGKIK